MTEAGFSVILSMVVPPVIHVIMEKMHLSEQEAITAFYSSKLYKALADEELKTWHYGPATLFEMFKSEHETGRFEWPEEAC